MRERQAVNNTVIDSESPWRVTRRATDWPSYGYQTSLSEWKMLLARAKRGDPEAEWGVADRYADGCKNKRGKIVVRRSGTKAVQWLRQAAEHGNSSAQNNLGILLSNGNGVRKNVEEALRWLRKAFHSGNCYVAQNIAMTYRENGQLRAAVKWFRKSAGDGDGDALVQLGIHLYWGRGVRRNPGTAVRCFHLATKARNICEWGKDDAFFFLGIAYWEGRGVKASIPTARRLFKRANIDGDHLAAGRMLYQISRN